jgi:hypothetical protein
MAKVSSTKSIQYKISDEKAYSCKITHLPNPSSWRNQTSIRNFNRRSTCINNFSDTWCSWLGSTVISSINWPLPKKKADYGIGQDNRGRANRLDSRSETTALIFQIVARSKPPPKLSWMFPTQYVLPSPDLPSAGHPPLLIRRYWTVWEYLKFIDKNRRR